MMCCNDRSSDRGELDELGDRVLGPIEVRVGGHPLDIGGDRQRRLLGVLILAQRSSS